MICRLDDSYVSALLEGPGVGVVSREPYSSDMSGSRVKLGAKESSHCSYQAKVKVLGLADSRMVSSKCFKK